MKGVQKANTGNERADTISLQWKSENESVHGKEQGLHKKLKNLKV